jgi:hypothetical protein
LRPAKKTSTPTPKIVPRPDNSPANHAGHQHGRRTAPRRRGAGSPPCTDASPYASASPPPPCPAPTRRRPAAPPAARAARRPPGTPPPRAASAPPAAARPARQRLCHRARASRADKRRPEVRPVWAKTRRVPGHRWAKYLGIDSSGNSIPRPTIGEDSPKRGRWGADTRWGAAAAPHLSVERALELEQHAQLTLGYPGHVVPQPVLVQLPRRKPRRKRRLRRRAAGGPREVPRQPVAVLQHEDVAVLLVLPPPPWSATDVSRAADEHQPRADQWALSGRPKAN